VNFKHGCFSLGSRISRGKTVKEPWQTENYSRAHASKVLVNYSRTHATNARKKNSSFLPSSALPTTSLSLTHTPECV
jgi:hypothetical protein